MGLGTICDIIILIAAVCVAVTNIYKFIRNSGNGIKKGAKHLRDTQLAEERARIEAIINERVPILFEERNRKILDWYEMGHEIFINEVKSEVLKDMRVQLDAIEEIKSDLAALAESAKDVLREKIMAIYHRHKKERQLEEHEKEALDQYYKDYKAIGGNSYIDKYHTRMRSWMVIPDDYNDDVE